MHIAIILNKKRKTNFILNNEIIDALAKKYQINYDFLVLEPEQLESQLTELSNKSYNAFLIAGGDGTVRTAAQALIEKDIPLIIFPLGTFNYFARELDYPNDLESIFKIIKNNKTKLVDVGIVNQTIFINHSVIGFYSRILKLRQKRKNLLGTNKLFKTLYTLLNIFKIIPTYKITLNVDNKLVCYNTFLIVIGNNYHRTTLFDFGNRDLLTTGLLSVYILQGKTRWDCFKCIMSILFNTKNKVKYLTEFVTDHLSIDAESPLINVDIDGELFKLSTPLNYAIHSKKLMVLVP